MKNIVESLLIKAREAEDAREQSEVRNRILTTKLAKIVDQSSNGTLTFMKVSKMESKLHTTSLLRIKRVLARWSHDALKIRLSNWHQQTRQTADDKQFKAAKVLMDTLVSNPDPNPNADSHWKVAIEAKVSER